MSINKKNYMYALLVPIFLLGSCKSSKSYLKDEANSFYKQGNYVRALEQYKNILSRKPYYTLELLRNTSFSYYRLGQYKEAEKYFKIMFSTFDSSYSDKEALFAFSKVLEANKKESQANKMMTTFVSKYPNDSRSENYYVRLEELDNLKKAPILFHKTGLSRQNGKIINGIPDAIIGDRMVFSMKINPKNSVFYKKALFGGKRMDYNIYTVRVNPLDNFGLQQNTDLEKVKSLNSSYDDYGVTTSNEGSLMFFTSNRPVGKTKDSMVVRNVIYRVKIYNGSTFGEIKKVSFDDGFSDYKTPFLSKDGTTLYYSSNKPGGFGGYDIYKIHISKDGVFSKNSVNLGKNINTESDEIYPYVSIKNKLYFSSNGLLGFGGYDIFENSLGENKPSVNLGKDINSNQNEISFIFDEAKKIGFYTSNSSSYGEDKMFTVKRIDQFVNVKACRQTFSLNIYDSLDRFPLKNVDVYISDNSNGKFVEKGTTDSNGFVTFSIDCYYKKLRLKISKKGYNVLEKKDVDIKTYNAKSVMFLNKQGIVRGKDIKNRSQSDGSPDELFVSVNNNNYINFGFSKYSLTKESLKTLDKLYNILEPYKDKVDLIIISHADSRGSESSNKILSIKRANAIFDYLVKKGFSMKNLSITPKGELDPIVNCKDSKCTDEDYAKNRRTLFKVIPRSKYYNK